MDYLKKLSVFITMVVALSSCNTAPDLGIFEGSGDIGNVGITGSVEFDPSDSSYTI